MMTCTPYSCQVTSAKPDAERAKLTKSAVVDRALQLADATGLEALTIRKQPSLKFTDSNSKAHEL